MFDVNQCKRFTHCPKTCHKVKVKQIYCHLKITRERITAIDPVGDLASNSCCNADFVGLWNLENANEIMKGITIKYIRVVNGCSFKETC